jgi:hypothetical protein
MGVQNLDASVTTMKQRAATLFNYRKATLAASLNQNPVLVVLPEQTSQMTGEVPPARQYGALVVQQYAALNSTGNYPLNERNPGGC